MAESNLNKKSEAGVQFIKELIDNGLIEKVVITDEQENAQMKTQENEKKPLPDGVYVTYVEGVRKYCRLKDLAPDMSNEDIDLMANFKQTEYLKKINQNVKVIKNWVIFFGVMAVIGLVAGFIIALT
ncbi:MAG: hypothetical protein SPD47_06750 [Oscillospiraceae bacterium]|nr:hypothetical protein [Oscillospiraceae bacterium]